MESNIHEHLKHPKVTPTAYVKLKQLALAREISNRKKVYLDTKYWAILRDVRLGRARCRESEKLLAAIELRVAAGTMICPLNADIYFEVMKQEDDHTLMATAKLIDDLSLGVCMIPVMQRLELEVFHFVEHSRNPDRVHMLRDLAWTKTPYVLGFATPNLSEMPEHLNNAVQKAYCDYVWTLTLVEMFSVMGSERHQFTDISPDNVDSLNSGKISHLDEHSSFKSVFMAEVAGVLDAYVNRFGDMLRYIYQRDTGNQLSQAELQDTTFSRGLTNLVYHAFRLNKVKDQFPSIHISAGLHAAVRWDRSRKYEANDSYDFRHAAAALPYCDLFFTERSLCHLLKDGNLRFDKQFSCTVVHKIADALSLVELEATPESD